MLSKAITRDNAYGRKRYKIELPVDEDSNWWFYAEFEGNDQVEMTYEELMVMDVMLDMTLATDDEGANSVLLEAYTVVDGEIGRQGGSED